MKIKSRVWHWLAVACGSVGLVLGMGAEGTAQTGGTLNGNAFTTAVILVLLAALFMKLGFLAQDREEREAKRRRYGKITRNHARNPEYPENQERGA
jgi:drug/metabolite transporter (DMT)-like permease